ncbi:MAG: GxxExxY protein, partial [Deltaproteobacteria bacterium]|nr:GxxExxY protein [Deltaproteobacteria bacterium]
MRCSIYKNVTFERRFRADLLIENKVFVENKAIKMITKQDEAQLINYESTAETLYIDFLFSGHQAMLFDKLNRYSIKLNINCHE